MIIPNIKPKLIINGPTRLAGEVNIGGAKNAALKMIAASILTSEPVILENVPKIDDVLQLIQIISEMGAVCSWTGESTLTINCAKLENKEPNPELVGNLRATVILIGPLLARFGSVTIHTPGGCKIGARSIETHIDAFRQLGAKVKSEENRYHLEADRSNGTRIVRLKEFSVTATENILMYLALQPCEVTIKLVAQEPEIENLCSFLSAMGAEIEIGRNASIKIVGRERLMGANQRVISDRIEAGTFLCAVAAATGEVKLNNVGSDHLDMVIGVLLRMGAQIICGEDRSISIKVDSVLSSASIDTRPYPGFPTDLQSLFAVVALQAKGKSRIFETLFEGRFAYVKELIKMGAKINVNSDHIVEIDGDAELTGAKVSATDLRGGASLVIAGLCAEGQTVIDEADLIDRGYQSFADKLNSLGAKIRRQG